MAMARTGRSLTPTSLPSTTSSRVNIRPTLQAKAAGWKRRGQIAGVVLIALAIVGTCLASGLGAATLWVGLACYAVAKSMISKVKHNKTGFDNELRATEGRLRTIQERWQREAHHLTTRKKSGFRERH
jgi:hypothetical protein